MERSLIFQLSRDFAKGDFVEVRVETSKVDGSVRVKPVWIRPLEQDPAGSEVADKVAETIG